MGTQKRIKREKHLGRGGGGSCMFTFCDPQDPGRYPVTSSGQKPAKNMEHNAMVNFLPNSRRSGTVLSAFYAPSLWSAHAGLEVLGWSVLLALAYAVATSLIVGLFFLLENKCRFGVDILFRIWDSQSCTRLPRTRNLAYDSSERWGKRIQKVCVDASAPGRVIDLGVAKTVSPNQISLRFNRNFYSGSGKF